MVSTTNQRSISASDAYRIWNSDDNIRIRKAIASCISHSSITIFNVKDGGVTTDNGYWYVFRAQAQEMTAGYAIYFLDSLGTTLSFQDIRDIEQEISNLSQRWFGGMLIDISYNSTAKLAMLHWMRPEGITMVRFPLKVGIYKKDNYAH